MAKRIPVKYEEKFSYDIVIENSYENLPKELEGFSIHNKKLCIVTETNVKDFYVDEMMSLLQPCAKEVIVFTFQAGESHKNLDTIQSLYKVLIEHKFERTDMLLALGGGVTGDLTGYAAATYLRGIDFVQLPTSLLAQVDSSIGGKTGVDFQSYKNMIGAFYQPKLVYMNLHTLDTLPKREYFSGMGEIIKHGLIKEKAYYKWLQTHLSQIKEREFSVLEEMIERSCQIKREVVERDPKEKGERALLNFGHTLGHAIEKLMNFSLLHGECVALGIVASSYISYKRNYISIEELKEIEQIVTDLSLPVRLQRTESLTEDIIIETSKNDKKMEHEVIKFILVKECGNAYIDKTVTKEEMKDALSYILTSCS